MNKTFLFGTIIVMILAASGRAQPSAKWSSIFVERVGGESTLDSPVSSSNAAFELRANTEASRASIRLGNSQSEADGTQGTFSVFDLIASAPVDKKADNTTLATLAGFSNAFTLELKLSKFIAPKRSAFELTKEEETEYKKAIDSGAAQRGGKPSANGISLYDVSEYAPSMYSQYLGKFFDVKKPQIVLGGSATIGHQEYKFLDEKTFADSKTNKVPYGGKVFGSVVLPKTMTLWTAGFEYEKGYKDAKSKGIVQPPGPNGVQEVKTGPIGSPGADDKQLFFLEMRRMLPIGLEKPAGLSIRATYDAKGKDFGIDVPIFLIRDGKGNLSGGIELGWQTKSHQFTIGVIVGGAFSLFGK